MINRKDYRQLKNDFNHIYKNIKFFYGYEYLNTYIDNLLIVDREKRKGFPQNIFKLLLTIKKINECK